MDPASSKNCIAEDDIDDKLQDTATGFVISPELSVVDTPQSSVNPVCNLQLQHDSVMVTEKDSSASNKVTGVSVSQPVIHKDSPALSNANPDYPKDYIYNVRWIDFRGKLRPILTQNENGPCPIIAIANVLSLRSHFNLPEKTELLTGQRLVSLLSDILLSQLPPSRDDDLLNYERTVSDAFNLFPSLQTGLDINVRFNGVGAFEFTPAIGVFDLFKIPLFHGWVVDPNETELASIVGDRTYNQLTEHVIQLKASTDPEDVARGLLAEEFLAQTTSQLTIHGLCELASTVRDGQLAILFRNNHYNTIFKKEDRIYVLVTDFGLLNEPNIVWETLNDVDGDTQFVDASFRPYAQATQPASSRSPHSSPVAQHASDKVPTNQNSAVISPSFSSIESINALERVCSEQLNVPQSSSEGTESDLGLAARLQLEEIQSSKKTGLTHTQGKSSVRASNLPGGGVPIDHLPQICSRELLDQAQKEMGSGSDLDVAVRLQWAELNNTRGSAVSSVNRSTATHQNSDFNAAQPGNYPRQHVQSRRITTADNNRSNCVLL